MHHRALSGVLGRAQHSLTGGVVLRAQDLGSFPESASTIDVAVGQPVFGFVRISSMR